MAGGRVIARSSRQRPNVEVQNRISPEVGVAAARSCGRRREEAPDQGQRRGQRAGRSYMGSHSRVIGRPAGASRLRVRAKIRPQGRAPRVTASWCRRALSSDGTLLASPTTSPCHEEDRASHLLLREGATPGTLFARMWVQPWPYGRYGMRVRLPAPSSSKCAKRLGRFEYST